MRQRINQVLKIIQKKVFDSALRRRVLNGAIWNSVGTVVTKIVTVSLSILLARVLGAKGFGEYGMVLSSTAIFSSFAGFGFGSTVTRYLAELKSTDPSRVSRIVGLAVTFSLVSSFLFAILYFFLTPILAKSVLSAEYLTNMLRICTVMLFCSIINSVQIAILNGLEVFKASSILTSLSSILQSILVLIGAYNFGVIGAVTAISLSSVVAVILYYFTSRKELSNYGIAISFNQLLSELPIIWKYSLPTFLGTIIVGPVFWLSSSFLVNQPEGFYQLGVYNVAVQWQQVIYIIPSLLSTASLPIMTDLHMNSSPNSSRQFTKKMIIITASIVFPLAIILSLFGSHIMNFYGQEYSEGSTMLSYLVFSSAITSTVSHFGTYLLAIGSAWYAMMLNLFWAIIYLTLSYFLVVQGGKGLAFANLTAYSMLLALSFVLYLKSADKESSNSK